MRIRYTSKLGPYFLIYGSAQYISVIAYVLGVLLFVIASFRARIYPEIPLLLWGIGFMPTLLALVLPAGVIIIAELIVSIGIIWIGVALWQGVTTK